MKYIRLSQYEYDWAIANYFFVRAELRALRLAYFGVSLVGADSERARGLQIKRAWYFAACASWYAGYCVLSVAARQFFAYFYELLFLFCACIDGAVAGKASVLGGRYFGNRAVWLDGVVVRS